MAKEPADRLLLDHLELLTGLDRSLPVLDLACGNGRNGLALAEAGMPVVFADKSASALKSVEQQLAEPGLPGRTWEVDLELPGTNPLAGQSFAAIIVFRYLHRPLFPAIRDAVVPGGIVVYETFTTEQPRFGRPKNPDFLLQPGELKASFQGWEEIYSYEGICQNPDRGIARIVARKPPA